MTETRRQGQHRRPEQTVYGRDAASRTTQTAGTDCIWQRRGVKDNIDGRNSLYRVRRKDLPIEKN